MAAKGRKPKAETPATLPLRGSKVAPKAEAHPDPPSDLQGVALEAWTSLCDDLAAQGSLDRADRKLMEIYCRTYAVYLRITKALAEQELVAGLGRSYLNPLVGAESEYSGKLRACLADLNLTTKARKPVKIQADDADPMDTFLAKK